MKERKWRSAFRSGEGIRRRFWSIFDRFYRGEDEDTIPGLGLGLPIAKALMEGQGGTIRMESELGKGSVLILNFVSDLRSV
jgi:signal transduction histidine kinase